MRTIARVICRTANRHAKTGDARSNQDNLPLITVALTIVAIAAHPMGTAQMIADRVSERPTGTRDRTRAPTNRVCANLTRDSIVSAGITSTGHQAAKHVLNLARAGATPTIERHHETTNLAVTTGQQIVSSAMKGHLAASSATTGLRVVSNVTKDLVDIIVKGDRNAQQDDPTHRIHAGKVARSASPLKAAITRGKRLRASSSKATTNSLMRAQRPPR